MIAEHCNRKMFIPVASVFVLISFAEYISLVIFALYINEKVGLLLTSVVVALPSIIRVFSGLLAPKVGKTVGEKASLLIAVCIMTVCYILYIFIKETKILVLIALLNGVAELLYQPVIKSMFSQSAKTSISTAFVHRIRYLIICGAGLLGPIIGGWFSKLFAYEFCLYISSGLYFFSIIPILFIPNIVEKSTAHTNSPNKKVNLGTVAVHNKKFMAFIISGTMIYVVFSQFESVYSLALDTIYRNPALVYSLLLSLNSLFGILLQVYFIARNNRNKKNLSLKQGIVFFQLGFALFAFAFLLTEKSLPLFIFGVFIYSIGEVVAIPELDIQIDAFAPTDEKNEYFSFAELRTIGFVLGPIVMSWLLENVNATFSCVFSILILECALIINSRATAEQ